MTGGSKIGRTAGEGTAPGAGDSRADKGARTDRAAPLPSLELDSLLASTLRGLLDTTGAIRAEAWATDRHGTAYAAALVGEQAPYPDGAGPDPAALAALWRLRGATDLEQPNLDSALVHAAAERGLHAAASLFMPDNTPDNTPDALEPKPIAVLLLGFEAVRSSGSPAASSRVRPRTLAMLDQVVARLQAPAATAAAIARLSDLDEEILRLNRLSTIGDLLAEVVHEVRNPLVSVKTFLQLLPDNLDDPDFTTNYRGVVIDEVRRMERLLDAVLLQARPAPASEAEATARLGTVLESVGRLLEQRALEQDMGLTVDVGADLPPIAMAEDPLRQIVLNLALNALEATPKGGKVRLAAEASTIDGSPAVDFIVDDQGPGVPVEQRENLFDPFFSTRAGRPGGLGLSVCRRLAHSANGHIAVEESPMGGARFRVRLPAGA